MSELLEKCTLAKDAGYKNGFSKYGYKGQCT